MVVGEKIFICLVRLYGSPTVVMWSIGMCNGRAKTSMSSEDIGVGRCREIATSSVGICASRAKGQCRLCNACGQFILVMSFFD